MGIELVPFLSSYQTLPNRSPSPRLQGAEPRPATSHVHSAAGDTRWLWELAEGPARPARPARTPPSFARPCLAAHVRSRPARCCCLHV